jgi:serine/threonine protein kinase
MFLHAEKEFSILQLLEGHKNIVRGIDYIAERERSRGFIVMEVITGDTILNTVLNSEKGKIDEK